MNTLKVLALSAILAFATVGCGIESGIPGSDDGGLSEPDEGNDEPDARRPRPRPEPDAGTPDADDPDQGTTPRPDAAPAADTTTPRPDATTSTPDATVTPPPPPPTGTTYLPDPFIKTGQNRGKFARTFVRNASCGDVRGDMPGMGWAESVNYAEKIVDADSDGYHEYTFPGTSYVPAKIYTFNNRGWDNCDPQFSTRGEYSDWGSHCKVARLRPEAQVWAYCDSYNYETRQCIAGGGCGFFAKGNAAGNDFEPVGAPYIMYGGRRYDSAVGFVWGAGGCDWSTIFCPDGPN